MSASVAPRMPENGLPGVRADSACFVCGPDNPVGLQAAFVTHPDSCTSSARVQLNAEFQGWQDLVHGGVLAALLDEACIYACRSLTDQCVTAELQLRYCKPVPVGSEVEVLGQLTERRKKIWRARAQLKIAGVLHAEAEAKIYVLNNEPGGADGKQ